MDDGRERTQEDVAELFGLPIETVKKIEKKALKKLRQPNRYSNKQELQNKVFKYYKEFLNKEDKSIITYLLFALTCNEFMETNDKFDYNKLFEYLHKNRNVILKDNEMQELMYLLDKKLRDVANSKVNEKLNSISLFMECLSKDTQKVLDTNIKYEVTRKGIEEKDIEEILKNNSIAEKINEILWYFYKS